MAEFQGFKGEAPFALMPVDRSISFNPEAVKDVENLTRHEIISLNASKDRGKAIVRSDLDAGVFCNHMCQTFGELTGLDQCGVGVINKVSFSVARKKRKRLVELV